MVIIKRRPSVVLWKSHERPSFQPFSDLYPFPCPSSSSSSSHLLFLIKLSAQSTPTWALRRLPAGPSGSLHSQTPAAARRNHIYLFLCSCFKWSSLPTMPPKEIGRSGEGERKNTTVLPTGETWDSPLPRTPGIEAPFHLQESCRVGGVCSSIAVSFPSSSFLAAFRNYVCFCLP